MYVKEDITRFGISQIYVALKVQDYPISKVLLYALEGAITNAHWNSITPQRKRELIDEAEKAWQHINT